jgi:serine/threonine-protein kinase HipA
LIAKFPSKTDTVDKAAWEFLAYKLAISAGINMAACRIEKIMGNHHTFLPNALTERTVKEFILLQL